MIKLLTCRVLAAACAMTAMMARADDAVTTADVDAAISRGVSFLTKSQNANGSWGGPTMTKGLMIYAPLPGAHHAFRAGASSLALCGMIDSRDARPETRAAIEKAAAWMAAEMPKLRRADTTTTYNVWGHAYGLHAFQRLHSIETDPQRKTEWARLAQQQIDLANRYEDVFGGWSYLDIFDELATQRPSGIPTSFTTATMLLAMASARDSMGLTLNEKTIQSALAGLRRQRTPDFSYTYSHPHRNHPRLPINRPAGSLARSQSCNAAMRFFGDETVTDEVIETWLRRFIDREGWLDNARKRPVPHEGHFEIAGYFYYYGIYYFTRSLALLPRGKHAPYARQLAAILIKRQDGDGSWWDFPLYSYHQPYGTGYALMALAWCRDTMERGL